MGKEIAIVGQPGEVAQKTSDVIRDVTWQECEINAEDCRIKAVQRPSLRDLYLAEAAYWDQMLKKLR
jgi:hypothetical protein